MSGQNTAETLAREFAALNKATERAHAVLADLRSERALLADERRAGELLREEIRKLIDDQCSETIGECVKVQLEQLGGATEKAMTAAVDRVGRKFDELSDLYLGLSEGKTPLDQMVIERVAREVVRLERGKQCANRT